MAKAETRRVHVEGMTTGTYEPVPVYDMVKGENGYEFPDNFYFDGATAVINTTTNSVAQIAGPLYQILQHRDYFCGVVDLLQEKGLTEAHGYAVEGNNGNTWNVRLIFDGFEITEPGFGRNIKIGGEFSNSYDSKFAARGRAYFMRLSCYNQMVLQNVIPECIFSRNHVAEDETTLLDIVQLQTKNFVGNLMNSGAKFKRVMTKASSDDIEIQKVAQLDQLMLDIFKTPSHAEGIAKLAEKELVRPYSGATHYITDRWELYNAATNYASHNDLTPQIQDMILYRAEKNFLNARKPIEVPAVATA